MAMNLKTTVNQLNNGKTVQIFDSTLDYDPDNNNGGWCTDANGPNPQRSDVTSITLTITKGDLTYTVALTGDDLAAYLDGNRGYQLHSETIFGSSYEYFEDGIYTITIVAVGTSSYTLAEFTEWDEIYEAFLWTIWNRIRKLVIEIEVPIKNYREAYNAALLNTLFDSIIYNCQYGQTTNAQNIIDYVTSVLDNNTDLTELFKNFENYG